MSYEDKFLSNLDYNISKSKKEGPLHNERLLSELLEKRERFLKENRPDEKDFIDIYPEDEIKKDLQEISLLKGQWEKKGEKEEDFEKYIKKISSIFEILLAEQIEVNNWLGSRCETFIASYFDDVKNGIDVGIIFETGNKTEAEGEKHLGFSTDVTFSSDKKILYKKLESIKKCIDSGFLPSLKYFQDPNTGEHKKIFLPKVVIGSSLASAEKLIELWGSYDKNKNKKLSENPIQFQIILESMYQLEYFYKHAQKLSNSEKNEEKRKKYIEISRSYAEMYNIFHDIYSEREKIGLIKSHIAEISKDIVYDTIRNYTNH